MSFFRRSARRFLRQALPKTIELEDGSQREDANIENLILSEREVETTSQSETTNPVTGRVRTVNHPKPVVYELREVTFTPWFGYLGYRGRRIEESVHWDERRSWAWDSSSIPRRAVTVPAPSTAMKLSTNYYHFLLENLPRIILLKRYAGLKTVYTLDRAYPSFVHEALEHLKIGIAPLRRPAEFDRLLFVAPLGNLFEPSPIALDLVRSSLGCPNELRAPPRRHVYLSRLHSDRPLGDEEKLKQWASAHGFEIINAERLSLRRQQEIFADTKVLIAPHGAGLANAVFMRPGTRIIEIMLANWVIPVYQTLSGGKILHETLVVEREGLDYPRMFQTLDEMISRHEESAGFPPEFRIGGRLDL